MNDLLVRRHATLGKAAPLFYETPLQLVRGDGVWLYDADGQRYLDAYNNVPVVGHGNPDVVAAMQQQAAALNTHTRYLHPAIVTYLEQLLATLPAQDVAYRGTLVCTGSEANELALRLVRTLTQKSGIICTNLAYHGNSAALFEMATIMSGGTPTHDRIRAVAYPDQYHPPIVGTDAELAEYYLAELRHAIEDLVASEYGFAGLLVCPIFANEGMPNVPDGYWEGVQDIVHAAGGYLIIDEVQSGFGRTGALWGHAALGITPDIITTGKPMGNGFPVAGLFAKADLFDNFHATARYFNTFGGNPVAAVVAKTVLDILQSDGFLTNVVETGQYLAGELAALQSDFPLIGDIRQRGLYLAVELVEDVIHKTPATQASHAIMNGMKADGVLISMVGRHRNVLKIRPPLVFTQDHADILLTAVRSNLERYS